MLLTFKAVKTLELLHFQNLQLRGIKTRRTRGGKRWGGGNGQGKRKGEGRMKGECLGGGKWQGRRKGRGHEGQGGGKGPKHMGSQPSVPFKIT